MKILRLTFLSLFLLSTAPVMADEGSLMSGETQDYIAYGAIILMLLLFVVTMLVLLRTFKVLSRLLIGKEAPEIAVDVQHATVPVAKPKNTVINKLLSLKPLSEEKDLIIEHDYDGIQELDNPTPAWFMVLFYATIVFAVGYLMVYHALGIGQLQDQEYVTEMKIAEKEKEAFLAKSADRVDENTVKLSTDPGVIGAGQEIFVKNCSPCHGDKGQGVVGPNLTDDYWLHGGKINEVFKTIKYGIQAKGMPNWDKQLSPKQIADVASYIESIHGTNPPGAKQPEGEKMNDEKTAANIE
ncbi:c-type cytochrome [Mucilaginibacter limnophilus]|uniref:C-type cytochrome n=1 Tax=Mucilaginibacter limnophilus TaxID=1932778 RepID=A0A437MYW3_9SPHI|nr:cbb3-type cytochrome c oxidase N-terminal domain-containing protein [Mucilaginibacter limnophilus]RVU02844.1 c-type cytochrome [Mucilaginibacter limnophilus]